MPILHRLLASIIALVFAAGVTGTFIVDDSSGADDSVASGGTTSTIDTVPDGKKKGAGKKPAESTAPSAAPEDTSSTTAAPAQSTTTTTTASTTTGATATTADRPQTGVTPTTPGEYTYDVTGTATQGNGEPQPINGTSTLTVSEPDSEGRQTQVNESPNGKTTTNYRFTGEGTYLESITMEGEGQPPITLTATSPFLIIPAGAGPGDKTTGQLKGDGLTADVTFTLEEQEESTSTARVDTVLSGRIAGTCDVEGTMTSTIVARSADQLPIDDRSQSDINATGGPFCPGRMASDTHSVLRQ